MDKVKRIRWTVDGISSLEEIITYIADNSPFYGGNFAGRVTTLIDNLKQFPEIGRIVPEYDDTEIRELIYQNYRIVYKKSRHDLHFTGDSRCQGTAGIH